MYHNVICVTKKKKNEKKRKESKKEKKKKDESKTKRKKGKKDDGMNSNAIVRINSWCALKSLDPLCLTYIGPVAVLARELIHYPSLFCGNIAGHRHVS